MIFASIMGFCQAETSVKDSWERTIYELDDKGSVNPTGISVKIWGIYEEKDGKKQYYIGLDSPASFKLNYPLNMDELEDALAAAYKKDHSVDKVFSEASAAKIFLLLYSLNQKNEDGPDIGYLNLGHITKPETNQSNTIDRIQKLDSISSKLKFLAKKNQLLFASLQVGFKNLNLNDVDKKDTLKKDTLKKDVEDIKEIKNKIEKNEELTPDDTLTISEVLDNIANLEAASESIASIDSILSVRQDSILQIEIRIDNRERLLQSANDYDTSLKRSTRIIQHQLENNTISNLAIDSLSNRNKDFNRQSDSINNIIANLRHDTSTLKQQIKNLKQDTNTLIEQRKLLATTKDKLPTANVIKSYREGLQKLLRLYKNYDSAHEAKSKMEKQILDSGFFNIEKVSVQFERGHLERVQVWVQNRTGGEDIYENIYAIGFTSITNYSTFQNIRLFKRSSDNKYIYLSDALPRYDNLLDLYTRDYSPADTVINNHISSSGPITLKKERNINLFESKIYTDLEGLNQDKPNGLIQIEIAKRFNLLTYRKQVGSYRADWSSLSYLNVFGALTKIEDKQKEFVLKNNNTIVNGVITSPSYISNLDLRRYENVNVGFELNTFLYDFPAGKFTAYLDFGFRYGHTNLVDSIYTVEDGKPVSTNKAKQIDGNAVTITFPKITFELFSQRRVGFCASYSYNKTYAFTNNQYKQVMSYEKSDLNSTVLEKKARGSHVGELFARIETNREGNGQLFFRTRLFWQQGDANTFFSQIQVGYNYNIIFKK